MFNSVNRDDLSISIRNGLYMPFIYKGHQVVVHNASWSFRETIWVDDEKVVTRLGISMTSTHTIDVAGDQLTLTFGYRNRMKNVFIEAKVGDVTVHELDHQLHGDVKPWKFVLATLAIAAAGAVVGYGAGYLAGSLFGGA